MERYSNSFKNCKRYLFLSIEADSPAKGRNLGVKLAGGTIIAFIDADCVAEKEWLINLVKHIPRDMGVIGGPNVLKHLKRSTILNAIDNVLGTYLGSGGSPQFLKIERLSNVYAVPTCNMAIHKKLFTEMGGFDERRSHNEDSSLCDLIHEKGYEIIYNPDAKVDHFIGLDSFSKFSRFIYKYGNERGKNASDEPRLFTKFNVISIALISISLSLATLSFLINFAFFLFVALTEYYTKICQSVDVVCYTSE